MHLLVLFTIIFLIEAVALYSIKRASVATDGCKMSMLLAMLCYATLPLLLYLIAKQMGIALTNAVWNVASTMYGLLIGIMLFHEVVSVRQWVGLGLGVVGFGLMTSWAAETN